MRGEVHVVGTHEVPPEPELPNVPERELVYRATKGALDDAGLARDELDTAIVAGNDVLDGRTISNVYTAEAEAGLMKDETKVALDGLHALNYGVMRLLARTHGTCLVVAYGKGHGIPHRRWTNLALDPLRVRPLGLDGVHLAALQAQRWYAARDAGPDDGARVVEKNLRHAQANPNAYPRDPVSADEVRAAEEVAAPLRAPEVAPAGDGAAAVVLTREDLSASYADAPAPVLGVGHASDALRPARDAFWRLRAARRAGEAALERAGLGGGDVDVAELTELVAPRELALVEALGLTDVGRAAERLRAGDLAVGGDLPVNPSGGALAGHAWFGTGLIRFVHAVRQVTGAAGDAQVDDARVALAHGATGPAHQANAVAVVGAPGEVGA